jgi:hypothetical protein
VFKVALSSLNGFDIDPPLTIAGCIVRCRLIHCLFVSDVSCTRARIAEDSPSSYPEGLTMQISDSIEVHGSWCPTRHQFFIIMTSRSFALIAVSPVRS